MSSPDFPPSISIEPVALLSQCHFRLSWLSPVVMDLDSVHLGLKASQSYSETKINPLGHKADVWSTMSNHAYKTYLNSRPFPLSGSANFVSFRLVVVVVHANIYPV